MQEQLVSLSQSMKTLKSVVLKRGMFADKERRAGKKGNKGRVSSLPFSNSETTIYNTLLEPSTQAMEIDVSEMETVEERVDNEVSFKVKKNRISSSSEEPDQIDTSNKLMNIDCEQFIAEC